MGIGGIVEEKNQPEREMTEEDKEALQKLNNLNSPNLHILNNDDFQN